MQITSRDIRLFQWINSFGFVFTDHVAHWMDVRYQTAHARIQKLRQAGLIWTERKTSGLPHLIYLTNKSWRLTGDTLPCMKRYNRLHTLNHAVRLIELSLFLQSLYPDSHFVSERWILHNGGANNKNHIPDGLFWLKDKKDPIAIELELSKKKRSRLQKLFALTKLP